jgi:hypothetical protein
MVPIMGLGFEFFSVHAWPISASDLERLAQPLIKNGYGQYLLGLLRDRVM